MTAGWPSQCHGSRKRVSARVSTGSFGGTAKCGNATASGVKLAMCAWADNGSVGSIMWYFKTASQVKSQFPALRAQIEKSS